MGGFGILWSSENNETYNGIQTLVGSREQKWCINHNGDIVRYNRCYWREGDQEILIGYDRMAIVKNPQTGWLDMVSVSNYPTQAWEVLNGIRFSLKKALIEWLGMSEKEDEINYADYLY